MVGGLWRILYIEIYHKDLGSKEFIANLLPHLLTGPKILGTCYRRNYTMFLSMVLSPKRFLILSK